MPTRERLSVIEPLRLIRVTRYGRRLRVLVLDGANQRNAISFRFPTKAAARMHRHGLQTWGADRTRLAYVRGASQSVLIDIDALFARAVA
jgi:hypothetical protein